MSRRAHADAYQPAAATAGGVHGLYSIGEAAAELGLKPHVLRFWETKFSQLDPIKGSDGRELYSQADLAFLRVVQRLLHEDGLTIRGAVRQLARAGRAPLEVADDDAEPQDDFAEAAHSVRDLQAAVREAAERGDFGSPAVRENSEAREKLEALLNDLCNLKTRLDLVRNAA